MNAALITVARESSAVWSSVYLLDCALQRGRVQRSSLFRTGANQTFQQKQIMKMASLARAVGGCMALHGVQGFVAPSTGRVSYLPNPNPALFTP